jgi:nucleotidyltransferase/DNA polymerase involved in DNA repair
MAQNQELKQLTTIPGVGKTIATDLWNIGIRRVSDLRGQDPEQLFEQSNRRAGKVQDRCLLYIFRCAVYYAEADEEQRDWEKLKWWNWKDRRLTTDQTETVRIHTDL